MLSAPSSDNRSSPYLWPGGGIAALLWLGVAAVASAHPDSGVGLGSLALGAASAIAVAGILLPRLGRAKEKIRSSAPWLCGLAIAVGFWIAAGS